jgi:hypothetical protein
MTECNPLNPKIVGSIASQQASASAIPNQTTLIYDISSKKDPVSDPPRLMTSLIRWSLDMQDLKPI